MTPEEKSLLERTYAIAEENNTILRSIRRTNRFGLVMKITYWVVIIGFSVGAFYFIQPYLNFITGLTGKGNNVENTESSTNTSTNLIKSFQDLLN